MASFKKRVFGEDQENEMNNVPTSEEFAPDLYQIYTDIISMIDKKFEYNEIISYINNQNWDDIIKLNQPEKIDTTQPDPENSMLIQSKSEDIKSTFTDIEANYIKEITDIQSSSGRETTKNVKIDGIKKKYMDMIIPNLKTILKNFDITIDKVYAKKIAQIDSLKIKLIKYLETNPGSGSLYKLEIIENGQELTVNVTYTILGYLVMLKTEINHDLLKFLSNDQTNKINNELNKFINKDVLLKELLMDNGKHITYNEDTAIALVLAILEYDLVKNISEKNGYTWIGTKKPEGASAFPKIWNDHETIVTSDADNAATLKFLTVLENKLKQYNDINVKLLGLDAGSSPNLTEGIQKVHNERSKTLKSDSMQDTIGIITSVNYNIFNPDGEQIIKIQNDDIYNTELYHITIFKNTKSSKKTNSNPQAKSNFSVKNLSIPTVIDQINNTNDAEFICNTAILKSLGDLIVYQVLTYITAVRYPDSIHITSSIDYSAIFTTLKDITYRKNDIDITQELNQCNIYAGCNFYGSNGYVPLTTRSRDTLDYLYTIVQDGDYQKQKLTLQRDLAKIFVSNDTDFITFYNLYKSLLESGLGNINDSIDPKNQNTLIVQGLTNLRDSLNNYASTYVEKLTNNTQMEEDNIEPVSVDVFDKAFVELLLKLLRKKNDKLNSSDLEFGGGSKKNNKSKKSKNPKKRTRKNRKNSISK